MRNKTKRVVLVIPLLLLALLTIPAAFIQVAFLQTLPLANWLIDAINIVDGWAVGE